MEEFNNMSEMKKIFIVVICGATASGKTALAVELAKRFDGEIISADSMQIYKKLDIVSAKPTEAEKMGIKHHLIDFLEPTGNFSVAEYVNLAREIISDVASRGKLPIICGGTGLYIKSLIDNIHFDDTSGNAVFRENLLRFAETNGNEALWERLNKVDPEAARILHPNNRNRIIRALEINSFGGKTTTEANIASKNEESPYKPLMIAVDYSERQALYDRINKRVDIMLQQGLIEEAIDFYKIRDYSTSVQAIGYKELKPYIDGKDSLEACVESLKQATRRYAKRQLTWFRRDKRINWISVYGQEYGEEILQKAEFLVKKYRNSLEDVI